MLITEKRIYALALNPKMSRTWWAYLKPNLSRTLILTDIVILFYGLTFSRPIIAIMMYCIVTSYQGNYCCFLDLEFISKKIKLTLHREIKNYCGFEKKKRFLIDHS